MALSAMLLRFFSRFTNLLDGSGRPAHDQDTKEDVTEGMMTLPMHSRHLLLAMLCVCQLLVASVFVQGQAAPTLAQQEKSAPPTPQTPAKNAGGFGGTGFEEDWPSQEFVYEWFIRGIWAEQQGALQPAKEGKAPVIRSDYGKAIGLRADEDQAMHTIVDEAGRRIDQVGADCLKAEEVPGYNASAENRAKFRAICNRTPKIVFETIAKLKLELGRDDFRRLDNLLYQQRSRNNVLESKPPTKAPEPARSVKNPDAPAQP
jgi:hypothetical protein